jgi:endonuclease YncB( thermonuclease family)
VSAPTLPCARGRLVAADGTVRFAPDAPRLLDRLRGAWRLRRSTADGSVALRLDGVELPELAYAGELRQPYAVRAHEELLERCGLHPDLYGEPPEAGPDVPAAVLADRADPAGRLVAVVVVGDDLPPDGEHVRAAPALVERSVNAAVLRGGTAYADLHEATPAPVRDVLREAARFAREASGGLWRLDRSNEFTLAGLESLTVPLGQVVLPRLFRRCAGLLRDPGARGLTLPDWLRRDPARDDLVLERHAVAPLPLSELVEHDGETVRLTTSPLNLVMVDR